MSLVDQLSQVTSSFSTTDLYVIAGAVATALIWLINNVKELNKVHNVLLSWVVPFVGAGVESLLNSSDKVVVKGTLVYFVSQVIYYSCKAVAAKSNEVKDIPAASQQF